MFVLFVRTVFHSSLEICTSSVAVTAIISCVTTGQAKPRYIAAQYTVCLRSSKILTLVVLFRCSGTQCRDTHGSACHNLSRRKIASCGFPPTPWGISFNFLPPPIHTIKNRGTASASPPNYCSNLLARVIYLSLSLATAAAANALDGQVAYACNSHVSSSEGT